MAPPVENPPPVQLVAPDADQVSVEGTALVGFAENEQVGTGVDGALTVIEFQGPQLLL